MQIILVKSYICRPEKINLMKDQEINAFIRSEMRLQGVTQAEMAQKLKMSQSSFNQRLAANIRMDFFLNVCEALNISPAKAFQQPDTDNQQTNAAKIICPHCGKPFYICIVNDK